MRCTICGKFLYLLDDCKLFCVECGDPDEEDAPVTKI